MKTITLTQFQSLSFKTNTPKKTGNPVYNAMRALKVNQGILVSKKDWKLKNPPNAKNVTRFQPSKKFQLRQTADNKSYAILRIK